jgi:hypothetical protein
VIISLEFRFSNHDSALFVKNTSLGRILLSFYVDDMIIRGDVHGNDELKLQLAKIFKMKDLGPPLLIGIGIAYSLEVISSLNPITLPTFLSKLASLLLEQY